MKKYNYIIHCLVGILFMFGFGKLPPLEPVTEVGMQVLGIFIGVVYLWSTVGLVWPSLLALVAFVLSDYGKLKTVISSSFGDSTTMLVLFAMVLFGAIESAGVTQYISRWFLSRKILNGRPIVFSFLFLYATFIVSVLGASLTAVILMMWPIIYGILRDIGYKKGEAYTSLMIFGTIIGAISGQMIKPFKGAALTIIGSFEKTSGLTVDYLPYMAYGMIMGTLAIFSYCVLMKFVFRPDLSKIRDITIEKINKEKLPPMDLRQKILAICLVACFVLVLLPSILPASLPFIKQLNKLGALGITIALVVFICAFKIDGKPIAQIKEIAKHINWGVFFLVASCMTLTAALGDETTGISQYLSSVLEPLLGGHSTMSFTIILMVFCMIMTNFANNAVLGAVMMPIMYPFALECGANPLAVATVLMFSVHAALLTPAGSPAAALLHGNRDWIDVKDIYKYSFVFLITLLILNIVIGIPLSNFIWNSYSI